MRSCAFCPYRSRLRPVREQDSRLSLLLVIRTVTLVLVSSALRKFKLPSEVLWLMLRSTLSQLEEVIGVQRSVLSIPFQSKLRESAAHVP